ncbi:MAG: leucine-rich repeat protein [Candidatus Cloacimonetes bacterium]|nr:leucine-rich repeat protein [Candidatus Cloacimonadota bacterium]
MAKGTDGLKYDLVNQNTGYEVSKGTTPANKPIIISATYNKLPVTKIADNGFADYSMMTEIKLPNTISEIGNNAFKGCSSLNKIDLPNSITTIGDNAFKGCSSLNKIDLPNSITTIGANAFSGCSNITILKIPSTLTKIGNYAFSGLSNITNIVIPNTVTEIGEGAFAGCNSLDVVTIPKSVTKLGYFAFDREKVVFPEGTYFVSYKGPAGGLVFYDKGSESNGWRYLEAAPASSETKKEWGPYKSINGTSTGIGTGKQNTDIIVKALGKGYAAGFCAELSINGFKDWFLPSKDELNLMYQNLHRRSLGGFDAEWYWSSSEYANFYAWTQYFNSGGQNYFSKDYTYRVRAVRAF